MSTEHRSSSAICNEGRFAVNDDDERAASDVTVGLVCSVWVWGLVCSILGFGLLCIRPRRCHMTLLLVSFASV